MRLQVVKAHSSDEYHYVFGEVYAPLIVDTDGESMTAEDIEKMAHDFLAAGNMRAVDTEHDSVETGAEVVESFIARKDDPEYREGAWVVCIRMRDNKLWEAVKSGDLNGFSMCAKVTRKEPQEIMVKLPKSASGQTESGEAHTHTYYVEFGDNGRVKFGTTDEYEGHHHTISGTVVTDKTDGHAHRYFVE